MRPAAKLAAEPQVGDDVEVVAQREVLEDGGDPELLRVGGARDLDDLAVELDGPGVRCVDAGEHLDEGGLAGAVVADERDDLALVHPEVDVGERLHRAEALGDAAHRQDALARASRAGGRQRHRHVLILGDRLERPYPPSRVGDVATVTPSSRPAATHAAR